MGFREYIKKLVYGKKYNSDSYITYLRKLGVKIGEDCHIYAPTKTIIDECYPWMITIGSHVRIAEGVKILTHDYSWFVLKNISGGIFGISGIVEIGNNVFIGMNTIITKNVKIGDNVVIGAGSVVTKDCQSGGVYAGVPAKYLMSIDEFLAKKKENQLEEAKTLAIQYYQRYGCKPQPAVFHEYFMLFETRDSAMNNKVFKHKLSRGNSEELSLAFMDEHAPLFKNFEEFINFCLKDEPTDIIKN